MKIVKIDFENKTFETDDGEIYPFLFDVDKSMTVEEFQQLIDKSENILSNFLNG
jgi:hypothetical protein